MGVMLELLEDDASIQLVQSGSGLVQQEQIRLFDQGPGNGSALLLPPGKLHRSLGGIVFQAECFEVAVGVTLHLCRAQARQAGGHIQVLPDRSQGQQIELLKDEANGLSAQLLFAGAFAIE